MSEKFGLLTAVSLGVGGIVGGGIYAAIGIVVAAAGTLTWFAYSLATVVVLACAYSYVKANQITDTKGGSVTFIEELSGRSTVAAVIGWTLVVGYIGTMAMYAYAFGVFGQMLIGTEYLWGIPVRPFLSVGVVALFVGINLLGAGETAAIERYLVFIQAGIITVFGFIGLFYGFTRQSLQLGLSEFGLNPIIAASVGFVSFEGWQLLFYSQDQFENPKETIAKGVYIAIPIASFIYILVGFVITSLLPEEVVAAQPEAALIFGSLMINEWMAIGVAIAALVSTASAINSTLFNEAIFAKNLIADGILPEKMGDPDESGSPNRTVLLIGVLTAAFSVLGSLESVVEFASLMFIIVFGAVSGLALINRDKADASFVPPLIGLVGSVSFFVMLLWYLYSQLPHVFYLVIAIAIIVFSVEALYFKRQSIEEAVGDIEEQIG